MFLSSLVMGIVGFLLLRVSEHMLLQCVWIFVCVVVYFAVLLGCFPPLRRELLSVPFVQKWIGKIKKK